MTPRLRKLWLVVHRWLGLTAGLLMVLLGLTGSLLVFDHAIDERINPSLLLTDGTGTRTSLSDVTENAEAAFAEAHPQLPATAAAVSSPRVANGVWTAWFQTGTVEEPLWTMVFVDPYSGVVTGQRVWGENLMGIVYRLHYTLLGGDAGAVVVGIGGILLMVSVVSGVWLWWPLWMNSWRAAFVVRRGRRFLYDLHKVVGLTSSALLIVVSFTGVYMTFPEWIKPAVLLFSEETKHIEGLTSAPGEVERLITAEDAIAIAQRLFPSAKFDHFHPPQTQDGVYEIGLRQPGEVQTSFGATQVYVDCFTGSVLAIRDPKTLTAADHFFAWQFPLHNGEAFGLPGRLAVFASGFTPALLYVTGVLLWWRRRSSKRVSSDKNATDAAQQAEVQRMEEAVAV